MRLRCGRWGWRGINFYFDPGMNLARSREGPPRRDIFGGSRGRRGGLAAWGVWAAGIWPGDIRTGLVRGVRVF